MEDAYARDDSSDSNKSFEDKMAKNPLRLSARHLTKPRMNPKSFDSDDDMKIFSKEQDHFLAFGGGASSKRPEGDEEFKLIEGEIVSSLYDQASSVAKKASKLGIPPRDQTTKNTAKHTSN